MGRFISRDPLGYVDGLSMYNGYFAEGFGLDPSGKSKKVSPNIWEFTPKNPNTNDCGDSCSLYVTATDSKGDNDFLKRIDKKYPNSIKVETIKELSEKVINAEPEYGKIKQLVISAHGNDEGIRLTNKLWLWKKNKSKWLKAFSRDKFCKGCKIFFHSCYVAGSKGNGKFPQFVADESGCKVYALDRLVIPIEIQKFLKRKGVDMQPIPKVYE